MFLRSPFDDGGLISNTSLNYDAVSNNPADYHVNVGSAPSAIQYVGGISTAIVGTTNNVVVSLTSLSGGIGREPKYGDLIIVSVEISGTANKAYSIADFTQIADLYISDTEDSNLQVGYKLASPIPETSVVITGGSGSVNDGLAIAIQVYRNVDQTTPFDVTSTTFGAIDSAIPNPPAITPVTSGSLIIVTAGAAHDATSGGDFTASYLSDFITSNTVTIGALNAATIGMGRVTWTSGAYDPAAWTFTGTGGTALNWSYNTVTMAIRPGPALELLSLKSSGIWNLSAIIDPRIVDVQGNQEYTTSVGSPFSFVVPAGVKQLSAVTIGGGGGGAGGETGRNQGVQGGAGGGLAYGTFAVTPGETLTVTVGNGGSSGNANGGNGGNGGPSSIARGATVLLRGGGGEGGNAEETGNVAGGTSTGTERIGGGSGGNSSATNDTGGGGGGAGGYSGNGGAGGAGTTPGSGSNGTGGGGGGGGATSAGQGYGGGGVGIVGEGTSGTGGALNAIGTGGSSGANGTRPTGGAYGGGGGGCDDDTGSAGGAGGVGAVRLVWGKAYSFPNDAPAGIITATNPGGMIYIPTIG